MIAAIASLVWLLWRPIYTFAAPVIGPVLSWLIPAGGRLSRTASSLGTGAPIFAALAAIIIVALIAWRFFDQAPKRPKMVAIAEVELKLKSSELNAVRRAHSKLVSAYGEREQFVLALKNQIEELRQAQKGDRDGAHAEDARAPVFSRDDKWLRRKRALTGRSH